MAAAFMDSRRESSGVETPDPCDELELGWTKPLVNE